MIPRRSDEGKLAAWLVILIAVAILFSLPGPNKAKHAPAPRPVVEHVTKIVHVGGLSGTNITIMVLAGLAVLCSVGIVSVMRNGRT